MFTDNSLDEQAPEGARRIMAHITMDKGWDLNAGHQSQHGHTRELRGFPYKNRPFKSIWAFTAAMLSTVALYGGVAAGILLSL